MSKKQTAESFWARVQIRAADQCWLWTGACNSAGYGTIHWGAKCYCTHRVAYSLTYGTVPFSAPKDKKNSKEFVLHKCDVRACCNPEHLFLGSFGDNMLDMYAKKRHVVYYGETHTNSKLTREQVEAMRAEYAAGIEDTYTLASKMGVSQRCAWLIVTGRTYK